MRATIVSRLGTLAGATVLLWMAMGACGGTGGGASSGKTDGGSSGKADGGSSGGTDGGSGGTTKSCKGSATSCFIFRKPYCYQQSGCIAFNLQDACGGSPDSCSSFSSSGACTAQQGCHWE